MFFSRSKELLRNAICISSLLTATACSSIVHNGPRSFAVNSAPEGAKVTAYRQGSTIAVDSGVTPKTFYLAPRKKYFAGQPYTIKVEKEGFKPVEINLRPEISGWYWGNFFFGGLLGMLVVDPATGSMWNLAVDTGDKKQNQSMRKTLAKDPVLLVKLIGETTEAERDKMVPIQP